ncbi:MAG: hypothetical protein KA165_12030, partial [Saprospiraceae bacterium]|nr:hypothetical protein [Saprospiraceae bacterium]
MTADVAGNRSVIFGCTTMWQAINVNQGAAVIFRDCTIGDGRLGLVFNQGFNNSLTELRGNYFVANSTAITAINVNIFTFATFSGNVFRAKWGIGPFVLPLLPPHGANEPIYGMQLTGVAGTIGTSGTQNAFYQFTSAILANSSNFTVNNCRFADNRDPGWGGWGGGVGIWAINSTLTIQNLFSNAASCEFIGNRRAVRSENTIGLTIKNAHFQQQAVVDIEVISSINPCNIDISNNIIDIAVPTERSIFVERSGQGGLIHTRVQSNIVTFPSPALGTFLTGDRRIMEFQARAGALDQAVIANNQITCSYGNGNQTNAFARTIDGIWIQGLADGYQVSGNIIIYTNPNAMPNADVVSVAIGMVTNNGINNILGPNNTITSQLFINQPVPLRESWLRCGLHIVG